MLSFLQAVVTGGPTGRIYARTDKPYYVSGELVTGSIVCEAVMPISASGIDLKISGYEKTEWHDLRHRTEVIQPARPAHGNQPHQAAVTRSIPVMHRQRGKKQFFAQNMRIYNIQAGLLAPGTYTFPFQYQLPEGLPGSFRERHPMPGIPSGCEWVEDDFYGRSFQDSDDEMGQDNGRHGLLAVVHYKLKVTLDINGFWNQDLYCRMPLIIHPKLAASLQPAMQTLTQQVTVCCCIDKGACTVCARFDKLAYVAGETADVQCDIQNDSTSNLTTRVILRRYLLIKANGGAKKNIVEDIAQLKYEPVPEKTKVVARKMPLQLAGDKVKPSTQGDFISCNYEYLVECGVSMGSDINLKMPVTIYAPQPPPMAAAAFAAPPPVQVELMSPIMLANSPQAMPPQQQQQQPMMMPQQQQGAYQSQSPQQVASPSQQYPQQGQQQQQYAPQQQQQQYQSAPGQPQQAWQPQQQQQPGMQQPLLQNQYGGPEQQQQYQQQGYQQQGNYQQQGQPQQGYQQPQGGYQSQPGNGMQMQSGYATSSSSTQTVNGQVVNHQQQYQGQQTNYGSH